MVKTLLRSLRQYKNVSLLTILFSMLEVVFEIIIPLCMARLIDRGIEQSNMSAVWIYGLGLLALALLQMGTGFYAARVGAKSSVGFAANLREDMYKNVQAFSFSNIDMFSTASIVTRLTTDVNQRAERLPNAAAHGDPRTVHAAVLDDRILPASAHRSR